MRKIMTIALTMLVCALGAAVTGHAQAAGLTAAQILDKVDDAINGPKDQSTLSTSC